MISALELKTSLKCHENLEFPFRIKGVSQNFEFGGKGIGDSGINGTLGLEWGINFETRAYEPHQNKFKENFAQ